MNYNEAIFFAGAVMANVIVWLFIYSISPSVDKKTAKWNLIKGIIESSVMCAEKIIIGGKPKKEWAMNFAKETLANYGINISEDQISALIEAAVLNLRMAEGKS